MRPICALIAATLRSSVASSSRLRSSDRPLGSPIMPVAPPARAIGAVAGVLEAAQHDQPDQVAVVQAVGGRVAAVVERERCRAGARRAASAARSVESWMRPRASRSASRSIAAVMLARGPARLHRRRRPVGTVPAMTPGDRRRRRATDAGGCARMFAEFARSASPRAPLYARLAEGIAADDELAGLLLHAPPTQRQPVLLFACVHDLLLDEPRQPSSPATTRTSRPTRTDGDPLPALRRVLRRPRATSSPSCWPRGARRPTRSAAARCCCRCSALLAAEVGPLAHLDVGTSAGLNLLLDRYQLPLRAGRDGRRAVAGRARVRHARRGARSRRRCRRRRRAVGLDRSPVDVHDPDAARAGWRRACGPTRPTASSGCGPRSASPPIDRPRRPPRRRRRRHAAHVGRVAGDGHPVVTNTWVLNYLTGAERARVRRRRSTSSGRERDLSWIFAESPALVPELPGPPTDRARRTGARRSCAGAAGAARVDHLADAHPHGYWLHWDALTVTGLTPAPRQLDRPA